MGKASSWTEEIVGYIREVSAIIHYFFILALALSIYGLIYGRDAAGAIILWLIVMLLSSGIAELLRSKLPTLLRIILHR